MEKGWKNGNNESDDTIIWDRQLRVTDYRWMTFLGNKNPKNMDSLISSKKKKKKKKIKAKP